MHNLEAAVEDLIRAQRGPRLMFQPVVDLRRGVVAGYEVLSRFPGPTEISPEEWLTAADRIGRRAEVEASIIEKALVARAAIPANCFLSINVGPGALLSEPVHTLLRRQRMLAGVVFELTEHTAISESGYDVLVRAISEVREWGAAVAVDDAGAGYASMKHIVALRPDFVKLDRSLVVDLHIDEAKAALVEMYCGFTSRIDALLIVEGIEKPEELRRLIQLGVMLGQGYLVGRPAPQVSGLEPAVESLLSGIAPPDDLSIVGYVEDAVTAPDGTGDGTLLALLALQREPSCVVLVDEHSRPTSLVSRTGSAEVNRRGVTTMPEATRIREALRRAMTRPAATRLDPLVSCDSGGRHRGLVPVERLVEVLTSYDTTTAVTISTAMTGDRGADSTP